jgi:glycosyltransferase involved in cell wall biosynthesis
MLRSFAVSALHSNTGNIEPDCIRCIPLLHRRGHCIYGGDFLISEVGVYRAVFELDIVPFSFAQDPLVNLDIYENLFVRGVLAERVVEVADLREGRRTFVLDFSADKGYRVEFRAFWREQSVLKAHGVVLRKLRGASGAAGKPASSGRQAPSIATVSAIIPCYNGAQWLGEAIASIKAQTRPADEIIVVDDGSTDDTYETGRQHDVVVLRNDRNFGEGASRNVGLQHAKGDLIAWLDADDLWAPRHVETLTGLLERYPEAAAAFAAVQRFGARNELIRGHIPPGEPSNVFWFAFQDWVHTTIGSMTRRSALLSVGGFDEHERYSVDFDLWLRLSRSHLFVSTYEVTSHWRWHAGQQSTQQAEQIAALYRFRRRYWEREAAAGDPAFAAEIESRIADLWQEEMRAAWDEGDLSQVRHLYGLVPLLPKAPSDLSTWARRAGVPDVATREAGSL